MKVLTVLILVFTFLICGTLSARILVVFPMIAPSHYRLGSAYARALVDAGHEVTMISPFEEKDPPPNYRDIVLTGFMEQHDDLMKQFDPYTLTDSSVMLGMFFINNMGADLAEKTLSHPNVQQLLNSGEKFDLVVKEQFVFNSLKALANHFDAPQLIFSTVGPNSWINEFVCNPGPPSYVPEVALGYPPKMTFWQRLNNVVTGNIVKLLTAFIWNPQQEVILKKYFPTAPSMDEINHNVSLVLMNSHTSLNHPVPMVPNLIEIGGFHVKPPKKLPSDLQEYLDNATEGVIYFSMGSNLKSKNLPIEKREAILETFRKLKVKVIWKWEDDVLPGQPPNVKLGKWLPQQDILAHPNVKLFITHGGLLSTIETIYHGKPVIAIPIFGDQKANGKTAELNGYGLTLPFTQLTEEKLTDLVNEMLNNTKYTENAKRRSEIFHDRPVKPIDTAVYWTEYVIRHKGAPHLRVAGLDLPWYQYLLLDVFAFISAIIVFTSLLFFYILKKLLSNRRKCKDRKHAKKE